MQFGAEARLFCFGPEPMQYEVWVHGRGRHGEIFLTVNGANLIGIATNQALVLSSGVSTQRNGSMRVLASFDLDDLPASFVALLKVLQQAGPEVELGGYCDLCGMPETAAHLQNVTLTLCDGCQTKLARNSNGAE